MQSPSPSSWPASLSQIETAARDLGAFRTGQRLTRAQRAELEALFAMCGASEHEASYASNNDLIGLCMVAQKNGEAAQRTAGRISARLHVTATQPSEPDPLLSKYTPQVPKPWLDPVAPSPAPSPGIGQEALEALRKGLEAYADRGDDYVKTLVRELEQNTNDAFADLRNALAGKVKHQVTGAVAEALKNLGPTLLNVSVNAAPPTPLGLVHKDTGKIIAMLAAGVNVYAHGPAGSGKTTVARKAAEAFGLPFHFAAKVESEYQLLGFTDAKGDAVRTPFREAYEHGGVFLFDEMDASSPAAVVALNAALANGLCPFPDAVVTRHKDFHVIGAGNTKLAGANRQYAGRNKLDAASIDRFAFVEFGYDDALETALATNQSWCNYVQAVRKACLDRGIDHLITPRATYDGCKLLAAGMSREDVAAACIWKGLDPDTVSQIEEQASRARR